MKIRRDYWLHNCEPLLYSVVCCRSLNLHKLQKSLVVRFAGLSRAMGRLPFWTRHCWVIGSSGSCDGSVRFFISNMWDTARFKLVILQPWQSWVFSNFEAISAWRKMTYDGGDVTSIHGPQATRNHRVEPPLVSHTVQCGEIADAYNLGYQRFKAGFFC